MMSYSVCKFGGKMCDGCMACYEEPDEEYDLDEEDEYEYDPDEEDEEEEEE